MAEVPNPWPAMAEHMGPAYLRYSFVQGTTQEIDFLIETLGLEPGMRVLDIGCGPGRHSHELARRGILAHGVDVAPAFIDVARRAGVSGASFEVADATALTFDACFDAAISLCQGGFGLGFDDLSVLEGLRRALRPGGRFALSAFNAYFQVRWLEPTTSTPSTASTASAPRCATPRGSPCRPRCGPPVTPPASSGCSSSERDSPSNTSGRSSRVASALSLPRWTPRSSSQWADSTSLARSLFRRFP